VVSVPEQQLDRPVVRMSNGQEISLLEDPSIRLAGWDDAPASVVAAA
jgi:hypothetical protein